MPHPTALGPPSLDKHIALQSHELRCSWRDLHPRVVPLLPLFLGCSLDLHSSWFRPLLRLDIHTHSLPYSYHRGMLRARHLPQQIARSPRSHHHPGFRGRFTFASSDTRASFPMVLPSTQKIPFASPKTLSLYERLIQLSQHRLNQRYHYLPS